MSEDRYGVTGRITRRKLRLAAKLNKRNRRLLTLAGLPLMAIAGVAVPVVISHAHAHHAAGLPSRTLCTGWARCARHGYPSYHYKSRGWRSYWRMSAGDECTNYVAYVESAVYHVAAPRYLLGNGGQWAATAAAHGVRVNHTPSVGAVAEWDGGAFGMGPLGHVAVVEAVGPHDSYILISQQNISFERDDYDWTKIKARYPADEWQEWPSNFIHFRIPRRAGIGYFNARTGLASLRYSQTPGPVNARRRITRGGIVPLVGDWRGDGKDSLGYYNPKYGTFHLFGVSRHKNPNRIFKFGPRHMVPLVGDWTGHGSDGIGYYDPRTGKFYLRQKLSRGRPLLSFKFGPARMRPLVGDWNGGRRDGVGYYDPKTGTFTLKNTLRSGPGFRRFAFGPAHMTPLVGNWTGGRRDGIGYYDRWTGKFALRDRLGAGRPSVVVRFGPAHMDPLAGVWLGG
jgi:surface antigen